MNCQSVNKTPIDTKAQMQAGISITRSRQIIFCKPKTITCVDSIQVGSAEKQPETFYPEIKECPDIRSV